MYFFVIILFLPIGGPVRADNLVGLIFDVNTIGTELERTSMPVQEQSCGNLTQYFWEPIVANISTPMTYAYDERK